MLPPVQYGNFSYQMPMAIYCLHNSFQFQGAPYWGYNPFHCWRLVSKINFVGSQSNTGQVYSIFKYLKTAIMSLLASLLIPWLLTVECSCQLACILGMSSVKGTLLYAWKWKRQSLSHVWLFATPWTVACQAPLSMGFCRQEYWSELPCPPPGESSQPRDRTQSPALQVDSLPSEPPEMHGWLENATDVTQNPTPEDVVV